MAEETPEKFYVSYNDVHRLCQQTAGKILEQFRPNLIIAIGGGGFIPARILRTFLKRHGDKNIPIQAIGLSLYEEMLVDDPTAGDKIGKEIIRTQWLDFGSLQASTLIGKNILIVDEVDDTRTTLHYAVRELTKDVEEQARRLNRENEKTTFGIFVVHNKNKEKRALLPDDMMQHRYWAGMTTGPLWIEYPWETQDIDAQDRRVAEQQQE